MSGESFKVIERSDAERVVEIAAWLVERGYKPVSKVTQMPSTGTVYPGHAPGATSRNSGTTGLLTV